MKKQNAKPCWQLVCQKNEDEGKNVTVIRKSPQSFAAGSPAYWKAVANQTVRTYVTLTVEPNTQDAVTAAVRSGPVKTDALQGDQGKTSVLTFLDADLLGESQGCGQQPGGDQIHQWFRVTCLSFQQKATCKTTRSVGLVCLPTITYTQVILV